MDQEALAKDAENKNKEEQAIEPPIALVKTWVTLANSKEDKMVCDHASRMLFQAFGDLGKAAEFCKKNGIRIA